jgi:hypothetical protein
VYCLRLLWANCQPRVYGDCVVPSTNLFHDLPFINPRCLVSKRHLKAHAVSRFHDAFDRSLHNSATRQFHHKMVSSITLYSNQEDGC